METALLTETRTGQKMMGEHAATVQTKREATVAKITAAEATRVAAVKDLTKNLATAKKALATVKAAYDKAGQHVRDASLEIRNAKTACEGPCGRLRRQLIDTSAPEIDAFLAELVERRNHIPRAVTCSADKRASEAKFRALREAAEGAEALRLSDADGAAGVVELRRTVAAAYADAEREQARPGAKKQRSPRKRKGL